MKNKLIAVHLLNDRSGSPLILRQSLEILQKNYEIELYTATPSGDGFLNEINGIRRRKLFYRRSSGKWFTLFYYLLSQLLLFFTLLIRLKKKDIVYINTLLPFGAAMAARIKRCRVIYHIHETSLRPALLKEFLVKTAALSASEIIFVSKYVAQHYHFKKQKTSVVYNSLSSDFIDATSGITKLNLKRPFTVTMLCSLKAYKGIYHFLNIARALPAISFELVLNAGETETDLFRQTTQPPSNCSIFHAQKNTIPFYERAHIVMNLSKPESWVETFGMTLLEAMNCGRPVICPTAGGVLELIENGIQGYSIDSREEDKICRTLDKLSKNFNLYKEQSEAAYDRSLDFSHTHFEKNIRNIFESAASSGKRKTTQALFQKTENANKHKTTKFFIVKDFNNLA